MQAIEISDIKPFMQLLFRSGQLDAYELVSADIRTDMTYSLDGHVNTAFFSTDELDELSLAHRQYLPWAMAKEKVFDIIRGKKTPSMLKLVLRASAPQAESFMNSTNSSLNSNDIDGFFVNILFQDKKLNVICGISYRIFTMDKELESEFSENFITLLRANSITCQ